MLLIFFYITTSVCNKWQKPDKECQQWSLTMVLHSGNNTSLIPLKMPHLELPNISFIPFIKLTTWLCCNESIHLSPHLFTTFNSTIHSRKILLVLNSANPRIFLSMTLPMEEQCKTIPQTSTVPVQQFPSPLWYVSAMTPLRDTITTGTTQSIWLALWSCISAPAVLQHPSSSSVAAKLHKSVFSPNLFGIPLFFCTKLLSKYIKCSRSQDWHLQNISWFGGRLVLNTFS